MELIQQGADALDAVVAGVNLVEDDLTTTASGMAVCRTRRGWSSWTPVMHGPTGRGGAVAALQNIRFASRVAKLVLEGRIMCCWSGRGL
jgi:N4-(beta-N-acetylglucosaminyl)-L-asparaginase